MLSPTVHKLFPEFHPSPSVLVKVISDMSTDFPKQVHKVPEFTVCALVKVKQSSIWFHQIIPTCQKPPCHELLNRSHLFVLGEFTATTTP